MQMTDPWKSLFPLRPLAPSAVRLFAIGVGASLLAVNTVAAQSPGPGGTHGVTELDMTTWSIAAMDPTTGAVGVAMASCVPETFGDDTIGANFAPSVVASFKDWVRQLEDESHKVVAQAWGLKADALPELSRADTE